MSQIKIREVKRQNFKMALPNIMTFMNLAFGIMAILIAAHGKNGLALASVFILFAAIFDRFDGKVARKLNAESELGEQLDSLADLVSFGVAPAFVAWGINFSTPGTEIVGYLSVVIFVCAGAYRLAKFNVSTCKKVYVGLPITCAGGLLSFYNIHLSLNHNVGASAIKTSIIMVVLAYCMVCNFKIKKV